MFSIKLPHRTSTRPADQQPLLQKGSGQATGSSSGHAHAELAGRGSPGGAPGAMAPRGAFLKRSDAMSSQAQASAQAAFPGQRLRFATDASVVEGGVKVGQAPVEFGAKGKPTRMSAHRPAAPASAPAPAPPQPQAAQHQEPTRGRFGGLFRSQPAPAEKPAASPPTRPAEAAPAVPPHLRTERTTGQKFSERLSEFMDHCPDAKLRATLGQHAASGNIGQFTKLAAAAMNTAPDRRSFELLQLMLGYVHKMNAANDYSDIRIDIRKR
jgi:hypothetical protein